MYVAIRFGTRLICALAQRSPWFLVTLAGGVVAGFILLLIITIPPITPADLLVVRGPVASTATRPDGTLHIQLSGDPRDFVVQRAYLPRFNAAAFTREVQPGAMLDLAILRRFAGAQTIDRLYVFDVRSATTSYLALADVLADRQWERRVTFPLIMLIALTVGGAAYLLGLRHYRSKRERESYLAFR